MVWGRTGGVLRMRKIFLTIFLLLITTTAMAFSRVSNSEEILHDMYASPSKYIRYGGASTGLTFLIDKTSVNVHKYAPPQYIIAARKITHYNNGQHGEAIEADEIIRYAYDYNTKKMYIEERGNNGSNAWRYITPAASKSYHDDNLVSAGEILFYLAYNMSFYDNAATLASYQFINDGISGLPLAKLPNGGDDTIWHFYNHKTNQIEWWKYVYNQQTKTSDFVKVR